MIEDFSLRLCEELGIEASAPGEDSSVVSIKLSDSLAFTLQEAPPGFFLQGKITPLPEKIDDSLLELCMEGNFLGQGTGSASVGIDAEEKHFILSSHTKEAVEYTEFKSIVENFVNYLSYWQRMLNEKKETTKEGIV